MQTQHQLCQNFNKPHFLADLFFFLTQFFPFFWTLAEWKKKWSRRNVERILSRRQALLAALIAQPEWKKIKLLPWLTCLFCDLWLCCEAALRLRVPTQESLRESLSIPLPRRACDLNVKSQPHSPTSPNLRTHTHFSLAPLPHLYLHPLPSTDRAVRCSFEALKEAKISGLLQ